MRYSENLGESTNEIINFDNEKKELKEFKESLQGNKLPLNPDRLTLSQIKTQIKIQESQLLAFVVENKPWLRPREFADHTKTHWPLQNRASKALDYLSWIVNSERLEESKKSDNYPTMKIWEQIPEIMRKTDATIEEKWNLLIFSKYLWILINEITVYQSEYQVNDSIKKAKNWETTTTKNATVSDRIANYTEKFKQRQQVKQDILDSVDSIMDQQTNLSKEELEEYEKAKNEAQQEIKEEKEKWKLQRVIDIVFWNTKKVPAISQPWMDTSKIDAIKKKQAMFSDLLAMYKEYQQYIAIQYRNKAVEFWQEVTDLKKKLETLDEDEVMERTANEMISEAIKIWGNPPKDKDAFMADFKELRLKIYDNHSWASKNKDENFTPIDHAKEIFSEWKEILPLLIKHWIFTSKTDLAREMVTYNGKKYVNISTRALTYSGLKWLNFLSAWNFTRKLEEYERSLESMSFNEKEAMLIALYRQTKYLWKYWSMLAQWLISLWWLATMDKRAWWNISTQWAKWFYLKMKNHAQWLQDYLNLAQKHLGQNNWALNNLNKYFDTEAVKVFWNLFEDTKWISHIVSWSENNKTFSSSDDAMKSLKNHLDWVKDLTENSKTRLLKRIGAELSNVTSWWDAQRKRRLWESVAGHLNSAASWITDSLYKKRLPKRLLETIAPTIRQDVAAISRQISSIWSFYGKLIQSSGEYYITSRFLFKEGFWKITKARLWIAISQLTKIWRTSFARIWSVREMNELIANVDIVLKFAPALASSLLRSAPVLTMWSHLAWENNDSLQSKMASFAAMICPFRWPLYIMDDAVWSKWTKAWQLSIGAFFLAWDSITLINHTSKLFLPWQTAKGTIINYAKKTILDPFYAASEIPKILLGWGQAIGNVAWDVRTKTFPVEVKVKWWGTKVVQKSARRKVALKWWIAALIVWWATIYLNEKWKSFDSWVSKSYRQFILWEKTNDKGETWEEAAIRYLNEKRPYLENNTKEDILQFEISKLIADSAPSYEEIQDRLKKWLNQEPFKPSSIDIKISKNNQIDIYLNDLLPYVSYKEMGDKIKKHITSLLYKFNNWLTENRDWKEFKPLLRFKEWNASFLYGKNIFEDEMRKIESTWNKDSLEQFIEDMKDSRKNFSEWEQKLNLSMSRWSRVGSWYTSEWLVTWMDRYVLNNIE